MWKKLSEYGLFPQVIFSVNSDLFNKSIVRLIKKKMSFENKIIKDYILCDIKHVCGDLVSKPTSTALNLISPN